MTSTQGLSGTNDLAERLLKELSASGFTMHGAFAGGKYCLAVRISSPLEAIELGKELFRHAGGEEGECELFHRGHGRQSVIFKNAHVQAARIER